jgi:anhydro-N-acetylmuramic acid kinase
VSPPPPELYLGLISGTSADAVDACLVEVESPRAEDFAARVLHFREHPVPPALRARIHRAAAPGAPLDLDEFLELDRVLGHLFADAAVAVLEAADTSAERLRAIGHHGQTVRHRPPRDDAPEGSTLQIGCAAVLVERLGAPVVHDLRRRDMALGGQGAPLVARADRLLFGGLEGPTLALNLGGIANLTWVPPRGDPREPLAFDTGTASCWLDAACRRAGIPAGYDERGSLAAVGRVDDELLASLLADPFYRRPPPRSTGLEEFTAAAVPGILAGRRVEDALATLAELTARTVADGVRSAQEARGPAARLVAAGGGTRNDHLMARLHHHLPELPFVSLEEATGVTADAKEAFAFALLAALHLHGLPGNEPAVTGASRPTLLGSLARPL